MSTAEDLKSTLRKTVQVLPDPPRRLLDMAKVDFPDPSHAISMSRLALATAAAVVGSLLGDRILVVLGMKVFPGTRHFVHFQFADYARLTVVGVVIACVGWPVVVWISSQPRWLFLRLAVLVTLVLLAPDAWILLRHESAEAVGVLVMMHLVISVVTYQALVRVSPASTSTQRVPL